MKRRDQRGFSLVELLVVIAIIGILASFTAVGISRYLEKAKITKTNATMEGLEVALLDYYTKNGSYPPPYGTIIWDQKDNPPVFNDTYFYTKPMYAYIKLHKVEDFSDSFSIGNGYETNIPADGLSILEFSPIGTVNVATDVLTFPSDLYTGSNLASEVNQQLDASSRPFVYIAYNERQFKKAKQYFVERGLFQAEAWDPSDALLANMSFPPPTYDKAVLIGVGPSGSTFGVVPEPLGTESARDLYHITLLRAAFLATRDLNGNGLLDFDFEARTISDEGAQTYTVNGVDIQSSLPFPEAPTNQLPDPTMPNNAGPMIHSF